jgi:MFS family permease
MFIVAVFTLGSGICGGANGADMLIIGRAVQGIGSGGINMIVDVIVSDLVPLRERGNFIAIVLTVYSIGSSMGPFVGGIIVQRTTWRWVFYINLPVGGFSLVLLFLFLHTISAIQHFPKRSSVSTISAISSSWELRQRCSAH